jgi:hypothetical protein
VAGERRRGCKKERLKTNKKKGGHHWNKKDLNRNWRGKKHKERELTKKRTGKNNSVGLSKRIGRKETVEHANKNKPS